MERHALHLPSGQVITSGTVDQAAIAEVTLTRCVSDEAQALPGTVGSAMLECRLLDAQGLITAGDRLVLFTGERQTGVFYAEKPEQISPNCLSVTAYDPISRLERSVSDWLAGLSWPMPLYALARELCAYCGLELATEQIPNGDHPVERFFDPELTGRELMQWICQLCGRFCVANAQGQAELRWFTPATVEAGPREITAVMQDYQEGELVLQIPDATVSEGVITAPGLTVGWEEGVLSLGDGFAGEFYYEGGCVRSDYTVAPVDGVALSLSGVTGQYPETGENVYTVSANGLLYGAEESRLQALAKTLFEILQPVTYTPCTLRLRSDAAVDVGQILTYTHAGQKYCAYIMTSRRSPKGLELTCTGNAGLNSPSLAVSRREERIDGRVLALQLDVEGLRLENRQDRESAAALRLTVEGITGEVRAQNEALSRLEQTAKGFELSVQSMGQRLSSVETEGVSKVSTKQRHYTFDDTGLHIRLDGEQMENSLDHTGMYVRRGEDTVLSATDEGVRAVDVSVGNYLRIGSHARIEDYGENRTACFYI